MEKNILLPLLGKIQEILSIDDGSKGSKKEEYLAWCLPGMPFQAQDLAFAIKGLNGADGKETAELSRNAMEFASIANAIPKDDVVDGTYVSNSSNLSDLYQEALTFAHITDDKPTDEESKMIENFNKILTTKTITYDIMDFDHKTPIEKTVDSEIVMAYKQKASEYDDAVMTYNSKRLAAINAESSLAVQDFAINGVLYANKVKQALNAWESVGRKSDLERIWAMINQIQQRSCILKVDELKNRMRLAKLSDVSGSDYYITSLYPSNFITSDKGWTDVSFNNTSENKYEYKAQGATKAELSAKFGFWKIKMGADDVKQEKLDVNTESESISVKFKITKASLGRGWFSADFLTSNYWTWDEETHGILSDGNAPAKGRLPAYTTSAIFVKDVEFTSSALKKLDTQLLQSIQGDGSVGWGPFCLAGASHSGSSKKVQSNYDAKTQTLKIQGMQLIAFVCHRLPKSPAKTSK